MAIQAIIPPDRKKIFLATIYGHWYYGSRWNEEKKSRHNW
jgi:hypothetical protein